MFGSGPHVCLGMKLARAETGLFMQKIVQRWPNLQADFDPLRPDFGKRLGMRTFNSMKVRGVG